MSIPLDAPGTHLSRGFGQNITTIITHLGYVYCLREHFGLNCIEPTIMWILLYVPPAGGWLDQLQQVVGLCRQEWTHRAQVNSGLNCGCCWSVAIDLLCHHRKSAC